MKDKKGNYGFTLIELIIVLAIIAAMITICVPYANRSNNYLKLREQTYNIAETIKYGMNLAIDSERSVRFTLDTRKKSYWLETSDENGFFRAIEGFGGTINYMEETIFISDMEGFYPSGHEWYLIFDINREWPYAYLNLSTKELLETIRIKARDVEIKERTF
jgi:prepilin-type N-terminal cleavage/methylation domain-containing protein